MKKLLSLILAISFIFGLAVFQYLPVNAETSGRYEYKILADGTAEIIKCSGCAMYAEIPSTIDGYKVTSIGELAFAGRLNVVSFKIPDTIVSIGFAAFYNCQMLQKIIIPNSVKSLGNDVFRLCINLQEVVLPNSISKIGDNVFISCVELKSIKVPDSITEIGNFAFFKCYN